MLCTLLLTITVLGSTYTVEKEYEGTYLGKTETHYIVHFDKVNGWLDGALNVPKSRCVKAD